MGSLSNNTGHFNDVTSEIPYVFRKSKGKLAPIYFARLMAIAELPNNKIIHCIRVTEI